MTKVDDTMDDIREQMDLANEISSAISNPLGLDTGIDEDELAAELEQLEQAELDATLLDVKNVSGVGVPHDPRITHNHSSNRLRVQD